MGTRGPLPKNPDRAQNRRTTTLSVVEAKPGAVVPDPPPSLSVTWVEHWRTFWTSDLAALVTDVDRPAVVRLFEYYQERADCQDAYRVEGMTSEGSTGQIRIHPLADRVIKLEPVICKLEADLGLTPKSRMALGIAVGEAHASLESMSLGVDISSQVDPRTETL